MHINISALVLAGGLATAAAGVHGNASNNPFLEQNLLIIQQAPPTCNLAACVGLSGTITCIISAVTAGDPGALQRCISNGLGEICSCAACIPSVSNFLMSLGVCVTSPMQNDTMGLGHGQNIMSSTMATSRTATGNMVMSTPGTSAAFTSSRFSA